MDTTIEYCLEQADQWVSKASRLASLEVERLARKILKDNPEFKEFVMANGTWFFTMSDGVTGLMDNDPRCHDLAWYVDQWDDSLRITGESMRFTATGPKVTNW